MQTSGAILMVKSWNQEYMMISLYSESVEMDNRKDFSLELQVGFC